MIDNQAHMVCVALVVQIAHVDTYVEYLPQYLHSSHRNRLLAQANANPFIRTG
jgi:hypothetical protein